MMGEMIVRNGLSKIQLLNSSQSEGMIVALAYAIQLKPEIGDANILNKTSAYADHPFTKHAILDAYNIICKRGIMTSQEIKDAKRTVQLFSIDANEGLSNKLAKTMSNLTNLEDLIKHQTL
jgi:hypothetical protein